MKITLVGYMASGKTTLGKALADSLNLTFIDLDSYIEKQEGKAIDVLLNIHSEIKFRKLERQALLDVLKEDDFVLAVGGGTPCYYNNMEEITASSKSIYLQTSPKVLAHRLNADKQLRPLVKNIDEKDMPEFVAKHLFERRNFYGQAAFTVKGENQLEAILGHLKN